MRKLAEYGLITLSIWIMVVGIYFFKFPNNFAFGGVTGFSTVIARMTGWSAGDFTFFVNTALLAVGFLFLGTDVGVKTVYASMLMSFSLSALERLCPLGGPLTQEPLLELIFAIFCPGFGSAVLFNIGASSGGTDIVAMILKKHTSMNIGSALLLVDLTSVVMAFFVFGPTTGLFSSLGLMAKSLVIDDVIENRTNLHSRGSRAQETPPPKKRRRPPKGPSACVELPRPRRRRCRSRARRTPGSRSRG